MKKWISCVISNAKARANEGAAQDTDGRTQARQAERTGAEIDAAYYRWLTASAGFNALAELETTILDQVQGLCGSPGEAAELVPRVPEVIPRLLRSLRGEEVSVAEQSRRVEQDVVRVAEVIREANSAYHRRLTAVKTVEAAIMMLGQNGLRMLLARIGFRPIIKMQPNRFLRQVAPQIWGQPEKCALAASLVAPGLSTGAFEAYLAGLMQNVGLVVAFRLAERVCEPGKVPASSEVGVKLLAGSRALSAAIAARQR